MTTDETPFDIGRASVVWSSDSPRVGLVATGALLHQALLAARALADEGLDVEVLNLSTVKPIDGDALVALAKKTGRIVTIEEHQIFGGMGSAVAECLAGRHPAPIEFVGVHDDFGQSGTPEELIEHYGMSRAAIVAAARHVLTR